MAKTNKKLTRAQESAKRASWRESRAGLSPKRKPKAVHPNSMAARKMGLASWPDGFKPVRTNAYS
jgi:hypothetical protein